VRFFPIGSLGRTKYFLLDQIGVDQGRGFGKGQKNVGINRKRIGIGKIERWKKGYGPKLLSLWVIALGRHLILLYINKLYIQRFPVRNPRCLHVLCDLNWT